MRFGLFVIMAGRRGGGVETYERGLVRGLATLDGRNEYHVFCTDRAAVESFGIQKENVTFHVLWPSVRWISVPLSLPVDLVVSQVELYHATFVPPPFSPKRFVFTMYDVGMFAYPEFYEPYHRRRMNTLMRRGLGRASLVLCLSQTARDEIAEMFDVPADRLAVIYPGVDACFRPLDRAETRRLLSSRYGVDTPYCLYVGQLRTRSKNLLRILEAFARFRHEARAEMKLVLAGRRAPTSRDLDETIARLGLADHVVELGHVPDRDLPAIYNAAQMLVFPSLYEGFGYPVVEAMACGTPVITSNASALPEVAGDAALLVDPRSVDDIAGAMWRLASSPAERETLQRKGLRRATHFDWRRTAEETLAAYERVTA